MSVKLVCPKCDSILDDVPEDEADAKLDDHNRLLHETEEVATSIPDDVSREDLNELMDYAREVCNDQQYETFVNTVINDRDNFGHLGEEE